MSILLKKTTHNIQNQLADYCRSGELKSEIPGTRPERLPHYRRLVFNVIRNTLEQAFPVTHKILEEEEWENLVYRFFKEHDTQTPQVWKMPKEFCQYVKANNFGEKTGRPYLNDLLWFEWLEIEVHTMPDEDPGPTTQNGNVLNDILVFNTEFRIMHLEYPVHAANAANAARLKGNYYVLIYRDKVTGAVHFIALSLLHAFIIEQLIENEMPLITLIPQAAEVFHIEDLEELKNNLVAFIHELFSRKIIPGFRPE